MLEYWAVVEAWLIAEARWVIPFTGLVGASAIFIRFFASPFLRPQRVKLSADTIAEIRPASNEPKLTVGEFIALRRELKGELEAELGEASSSEKNQLNARIAALQAQISNPDDALKEAQQRIADLEALLDRTSNDIGSERIDAAKQAMEHGDYSAADAIFEEIEAKAELAVKASSRAAYGRGEVAEAEVRWADAAEAYRRAAELDPSYRTLTKAHEFAHWSGQYDRAKGLGEDLVRAAEREGDLPNLSMAKNDLAMTLRALGDLDGSEALYTSVLEIDRASIGEEHPDYAVHLNNFARLKRQQGKLEEAEQFYRQALEIGRKAKGEDHVQYANHLHNLAGIVEAQGRFEEAEPLLREALEVDRRTVGTGHPHYALHMKNHARVLAALGRTQEARSQFEEAIGIFRSTLPDGHPYLSEAQEGLAAL